MADTRAEVRALRRALRLKNVGAEELVGQTEENDISEGGSINSNQLTALDILAKQMNVNVEAVIAALQSSGTVKAKKLGALSENDGTQLCKSMSGFQADSSKIPAELLGYNSNWRQLVE